MPAGPCSPAACSATSPTRPRTGASITGLPARRGGGARSAAYYARYIAKNLVASRLCTKAEVQLAYAIGVAAPVSIAVDSFGTGKLPDDRLEEIVEKIFDARPANIIRELDLLRPIYSLTAAYGHFGRHEPEFTWERTDRAEALAAAAG